MTNAADTFICGFDKSQHGSLDDLLHYLKKFRIKQEDYFKEYHPKKDLLTNEDIPFKNPEHYLSTYFASKITMKSWYKKYPEEAKVLSIKLLKDRIRNKNLKSLPGEVELISAGLPSSQYYYRFIREELDRENLSPKFDYTITEIRLGETPEEIIVDTREQQPLNLKGIKTISQGLSFGDYSLVGGENGVVVERKSLADLISSCVKNYDRFRKEFERAKQAGAYMVVLCEESLSTALNFCYIPHFKKYTKIRPEVVFYNIRQLIQDFDYQFVFCDGRVKSAEVLMKIFAMQNDVRKIDLQWALDRAKIL